MIEKSESHFILLAMPQADPRKYSSLLPCPWTGIMVRHPVSFVVTLGAPVQW